MNGINTRKQLEADLSELKDDPPAWQDERGGCHESRALKNQDALWPGRSLRGTTSTAG